MKLGHYLKNQSFKYTAGLFVTAGQKTVISSKAPLK